jgi:potassium/chloride transporter 9
MEVMTEQTTLITKPESINSMEHVVEKENLEVTITHHKKSRKSEKLGMIMGVLIPVILSIWGVILFLRLGVLVGQMGIWATFGLFIFSYTITTLTIISVSAITTNGRVKGGGVYYLISRSLGPELGGSIGLIYGSGQIVSGGLFIVGFTEALVQAFPSHWPKWVSGPWMKFLYGVLMLTVLAIVCFIGADFFAKASLIIFFILLFSIVFAGASMLFGKPGEVGGFTGPSIKTLVENFELRWQKDYDNPNSMFNLQYAFGILFPACTGIMTGANMSGDLENPGQDIPTGTLLANGFTFVTYIGLAFILALTLTKQTLVEHSSIIIEVSFWPWVITMGVFAAALSSALGNIIGGSRIIQAIARDELLPALGFFKVGSGSNDEPRRAVVFVYIMIALIVMIGDINSIAPIITVLQTLTYGFVNFSCFFLSITGAPNFRPTFRLFSWWTALAGGLMCIGSMFYVSPLYAAIALAIQALLIILVHFWAPHTPWGDVSQALIYHQVRKYLLRLENKEHVKTWRLQVLHLVANPRSSINLISFCNSLKKGGLYIVGNCVVGNFRETVDTITHDYEAYYDFFREMSVKAFPDIAVASSVREGCQNLLTQSGMGGMKPNTIIIGFHDSEAHPVQNQLSSFSKKKKALIEKAIDSFSPLRDKENPSGIDKLEYLRILKDCTIWKKNVCIARHFEKFDKDALFPTSFLDRITRKKNLYIDLFIPTLSEWKNNEASISLIVQMGYMISLVSTFAPHHKLRIVNVVDDENMLQSECDRIQELMQEWRIEAIPRVYALSEKDRGVKNDTRKVRPSNGIVFGPEICGTTTLLEKYRILNRVLLQGSHETSVIFMPLPPLPEEETRESAEDYLDQIAVLSDNLPPCMLIRGCDKVINEEF